MQPDRPRVLPPSPLRGEEIGGLSASGPIKVLAALSENIARPRCAVTHPGCRDSLLRPLPLLGNAPPWRRAFATFFLAGDSHLGLNFSSSVKSLLIVIS
jgi:hypothetical protein